MTQMLSCRFQLHGQISYNSIVDKIYRTARFDCRKRLVLVDEVRGDIVRRRLANVR